jgi:hypothetical protein
LETLQSWLLIQENPTLLVLFDRYEPYLSLCKILVKVVYVDLKEIHDQEKVELFMDDRSVLFSKNRRLRILTFGGV